MLLELALKVCDHAQKSIIPVALQGHQRGMSVDGIPVEGPHASRASHQTSVRHLAEERT